MDGNFLEVIRCPACGKTVENPCSLACGHSYCQKCIEKCFYSKKIFVKNRAQSVICPLDGKTTTYSGTKNFMVDSILQQLEERRKKFVVCACNNEVPARQMYECQTCSDKTYVCSFCILTLHNHHVSREFLGPDYETKLAELTKYELDYKELTKKMRDSMNEFLKHTNIEVRALKSLKSSALEDPLLSNQAFGALLVKYSHNRDHLVHWLSSVQAVIDERIRLMKAWPNCGCKNPKNSEIPNSRTKSPIRDVNTEIPNSAHEEVEAADALIELAEEVFVDAIAQLVDEGIVELSIENKK